MATHTALNAKADPFSPRSRASAAEGDYGVRARAGHAPSRVKEEAQPFGEHQSEAEARLFASPHGAPQEQHHDFAPLRHLTSRLAEFSEPLAADFPERATAAARERQEERDGISKQWLAAEIGTLKAQLLTANAGIGSLHHLDGRLDAAIQRLERQSSLPAAPSGEGIRISRAAKEIMLSAEYLEGTRREFQAAAAIAGEGFKESVKAAALEVASLTAERIEGAMQNAFPVALGRVETELKSMNARAAETSARTVQALERMHVSIQRFLEQAAVREHASTPTPPSSRPSGPHKPVGATERRNRAAGLDLQADVSDLRALLDRGSNDDGISHPARQETQDDAPPQEAPRFLRERRTEAASQVRHTVERVFNSRPSVDRDTRTASMTGIAIVAAAMLLASAALYYLHHTRGTRQLGVLSMATDSKRPAPSPPPTVDRSQSFIAMSKSETASGLPLEIVPAANASSGKAGADAEDVRRMLASASGGDAAAQYKVGTQLIDAGQGASAGARWVIRAAEQGHTDAQFLLASLYERGAGIAQDDRKAIEFYRKAAMANHVQAMHNLGVVLHRAGGRQAQAEAALWFAKAAATGATASQYNLALFYEWGLGVERDLTKAYFWYLAAGAAGDTMAMREAERISLTLPSSVASSIAASAKNWRAALGARP